MNSRYVIADPSQVFSPALLFYKELIVENIKEAIRLAGSPARLRPHVKTHKTREIIQLELAHGITKHKCATLAEAEMLASCGVRDVFLAYNMVGPNCERLARLVGNFPECRFSVTGDDPTALRSLSRAMAAAGPQVEILLDLDVGMHRTGIVSGQSAVDLYELVAQLPGLAPGGLHVYDGHNHQETAAEREAAVRKLLAPVLELRATLEKKSLPVPRVVAGGTPTFPVFARMEIPGLECAPGTCILHDHGYGSRYGDMPGFVPAALLLTRVMSKPAGNRLTLDLGYKALASDPPAGKRCVLLDIADYEPLIQNEEHFVVQTPAANRFQAGDVIFAIPTHVCPTCAVHRFAYVVENGRIAGRWEIAARDRVLTV
jgi:D-serine deaminase-like pyridoxal phosphate-dependent protein